MNWDYKDQLKDADLGGGGTAYYTYDASGKRTRKTHAIKYASKYSKYAAINNWTRLVSSKQKEFFRNQVNKSVKENQKALKFSTIFQNILNIPSDTTNNE